MIQAEWLLIALNVGVALGWFACHRFGTMDNLMKWFDEELYPPPAKCEHGNPAGACTVCLMWQQIERDHK